MTHRTGRCTCGAIRIETTGQPKRVGVCHCFECRKHHGAVFYAAAVFDPTAVTITGETGHHKGRHFCPTCGSSVFALSGDEVEVHLGTFDDPDQFTPTYELWTCRRESWLHPIAGATQYARGRND